MPGYQRALAVTAITGILLATLIGHAVALPVQGNLAITSGHATIAEGAFTAPVLARLAREKGIDMPVVDAVDALISGRANVDQVLEALLSRPLKSEGI